MKIAKGFDNGKAASGRKAYFISVDRRKRYFETMTERDEEFTRVSGANAFGIDAQERPTARDLITLHEMKNLSAGRAEPLMEIFRLGLEQLPKHHLSIADARKRFLAEKKAAREAKTLRRNSYSGLVYASKKLVVPEAPFHSMNDLRNPRFENWLRALPFSPKSLKSFTSQLGVFLNWCVLKKYLVESPLKNVAIPNPPSKRIIYSADRVRELFNLAEKDFPDLVPLFALEWFAGIRPETADRVVYEDIDRKDKVIGLRRGKFKEGEMQFVERIPETLWAWLPKKGKGRVSPINWKKRIAAFNIAAGYKGKKGPDAWPTHVARHTFVSHFAALSGDMGKVSFSTNHSDIKTPEKHYRRRLPKAEGVKYFDMRPSKK